MWLRQAYSGEEILSSEVLQIDLGPLHSAGTFIRPALFDIEVLCQGNAREKGLTLVRLREELGDEAERLENAVLAFQRVRRRWCPFLHGELK